jgi:membrane fusion protein, copper/silver efflux system
MADLVEAAAAQLMALGVSRRADRPYPGHGSAGADVHAVQPRGWRGLGAGRRQGEWLMGGGRLMRVAGLGRVWAQFEAYERDLAQLRSARPLQFTVESFPGETFAGTVSFIDPVVDGGRRTARIRVQVDNPGGRLKPGMLVRGPGDEHQRRGAGRAGHRAPVHRPAGAGLRAAAGYDRPTFEPREGDAGRPRRARTREVTSGLAEGSWWW